MPGIRMRRISHLQTKPFMCMPCICACTYLTSVNQALDSILNYIMFSTNFSKIFRSFAQNKIFEI